MAAVPIKCEHCDFTVYNPCSATGRPPVGCKNRIVSQGAFMQQHFDTPRAKLLNEVMEIVHKDRNANYGNPENNFQQIADLWNAYWKARNSNVGRPEVVMLFIPHDVAIMNMMIKIARLAKSPQHHDSAVDIAGYAACLADIQESGKPVGSASA